MLGKTIFTLLIGALLFTACTSQAQPVTEVLPVSTDTVTATSNPLPTPNPTQTATIPTPLPTSTRQPVTNITVVLFGDSITWGQALYGSPLGTYLATLLPGISVDFKPMGYSCQRVDSLPISGCGGQINTPAPFDVFENVIIPMKPAYLLLFFGMNIRDNSDVDNQITDYAKIIDTMPGTLVIILTPVHDCSDPIHDKILDLLADREIAFSAGSGTPLIDVRSFLGVGPSECSLYYGSDQVHPNAIGQKYISKYIAGELARIITKP